ncbi:MAG TPA: hypothetical protein VG962_11850 [Steroidobacteraceae bacterium]|nr:hypothetical protein [Steroidobacteraceae bacterium]
MTVAAELPALDDELEDADELDELDELELDELETLELEEEMEEDDKPEPLLLEPPPPQPGRTKVKNKMMFTCRRCFMVSLSLSISRNPCFRCGVAGQMLLVSKMGGKKFLAPCVRVAEHMRYRASARSRNASHFPANCRAVLNNVASGRNIVANRH